MQIKINLQIFLFIVVFALTHQIKIYAIIMLFALAHELGHLLCGILLNLKPKSISIMPFGVSINFEIYEYRKLIELKKIIIAVAGPITNILISIITIFLKINIEIKELIIYSNILIATFNMIPLYPLDGGRILKAIIKMKYKGIEGDVIINKISNIVLIILTALSSIAILYLKNIAIAFIVLYLWIIVIKENKRFYLKKEIYNTIQKANKHIDN